MSDTLTSEQQAKLDALLDSIEAKVDEIHAITAEILADLEASEKRASARKLYQQAYPYRYALKSFFGWDFDKVVGASKGGRK